MINEKTFIWHEFTGEFKDLPKQSNAAYALMEDDGRILANNKNVGGLFTHSETIKLLKKGVKYFMCISF